MKKYNTIYINNEKDLEYIKNNKFHIFNSIITGPSNMIDKISDDNELYLQLLVQQNRFAINNKR